MQYIYCFGKITINVFRVECHHGKLGFVCSQSLFKLLCKCYYASIGTSIPGTVVAHK